MEFKFVRIKSQALFNGEMITKNVKWGLGLFKDLPLQNLVPEKLKFM
jgi:hypothetical protein